MSQTTPGQLSPPLSGPDAPPTFGIGLSVFGIFSAGME